MSAGAERGKGNFCRPRLRVVNSYAHRGWRKRTGGRQDPRKFLEIHGIIQDQRPTGTSRTGVQRSKEDVGLSQRGSEETKGR